MKTKSATEQPPLLLCEVLEEEFVQLHGKLPYAPSWEFKGAHFRTDASGTPRLLTTLKTREDELAKHLLDQVGLRSILSADELSAKLNALLQAPALNSIAQASQPASHATPLQKLLGLRSGVDSASLRRHAIEESFPDDIEPIHEIRLRQVYDAIHRLSEEAETGAAPYANRAALCLSGGGIRSATFGLGVLQALARRGVIGAFSFVSTVSGGGFVGSWFSAWIHRHPQGLDGVVRELALAQAPDAFTSKPKLEPEVPPIRHLRSYSNYLSPKLGFLSADAWTLGTIYLRNLLLNWLVIIPLLLALLALPRFLVMAMWLPANHALQTAALALGTVAAIAAIVYASVNRPGAHRHVRIREGSFWCFAQTQSGFLRLCLTPLLLAALCFQLHWIWFCASGRPPYAWWQFALFGTAVHSVGWLAGFLILARQENEPQSGKARRTAWVHEFIGVVVTGAAGGLLVGWGALKLFSPTLLIQPANELLFASFATPAFLALFLMAATLFVGAVSRWTSDEDREWWGRVGAWVLIALTAWTILCALVVLGPMGFVWLGWKWQAAATSVGGLSGLVALLLGRSPTTPGTKGEAGKSDWKSLVLNKISCLAAPLFIVVFLVLLSFVTSLALHGFSGTDRGARFFVPQLVFPDSQWPWEILVDSGWLIVIGFILACGLFGLVMALLLNVNKFSLHSIYRDRLIRAYLGASRLCRCPNPFTGFDPDDNMPMHQLREGNSPRPLHIINIALNLVKGENLAWQERKAETFTVSALHSGNFRLGYRRSEDYGRNRKSGRAISLGTAVTISGAAASPNMGYHSSPVVTFLLALFNVRLGWWLGNPGIHGQRTYKLSCPNIAIKPMIHEALGLTTNRNPYIYLSDGGHFENLGVYEMVLRRCHCIVVSDAGCDPECAFEDLGNAIRKVRIDLGVPIELKEPLIYSRRLADKASRYCAIGTINYQAVDGPSARNGTLIYLKPVIRRGQPMDVFNYASTSAAFPHESTGDQFFSETQFESYRMLGCHTVEEIFRAGEPLRPNRGVPVSPLKQFVQCAEGYLRIAESET